MLVSVSKILNLLIPMKKGYQNRTISYYNTSQWLYRLFVYNQKSLGMHHGFWNASTKNRHEAMLNVNQAIIDLIQIQKTQNVLDAGCGIGGTAIYIAKKTGARVTAITLVPKQIQLARKYAKQKGVSHLTKFLLRDYTNTKFPDKSFDLVYGIESICYASPKKTFLKEAHRILKPGGKIIIADGYRSRTPRTEKEKKIINDFINAFALEELITSSQMTHALIQSNFTNIKTFDKSNSVKPSVNYYSKLGAYARPLAKLLSLVPNKYLQAIDRNRVALQCEGKFKKIGLATYYIHLAEKPK